MPSFVSLSLTDQLACQGSVTRYGLLRPEDLEDVSDVQAIEDQESLSFSYTRVDVDGTARAISTQMRPGRIVTVTWSDGFDEWRVATVQDGRGLGGLVRVTCVPLWLDLIERADSATGQGWVSQLSNAERVYDFEIAERSASSIWSTYIIPACPAWVTAGTIDPTYTIPALSVDRMTPGALAIAVRDALRDVDIPCELRLRRNGTTDYQLDLVTQVGAGATTPVFHPAVSLATLSRKVDQVDQGTRILVTGGQAPDSLPGVLGRARWRGGAPSGGAIALADPNGGASPVAFDGQWVGAYLLRVKTGRTFPITGSSAAAGTVSMADVSTIAAGEDFEFRLTEPGTNTRTTTARTAISAVGATSLTVPGAIAVDDQYVDWYAKVWSASSGGTVIATLRISDSVASTDVLTTAATTGVTTSHYVEFVQTDGAGEVPSFVDHPTYSAAAPAGYGIKTREIQRPEALGVVQLVPNPFMRTWTNGSNPPDGYAKSGASSISRNADPLYTRYGGYSLYSSAWQGVILTSPAFYPNVVGSLSRLTCRVWMYFTAWTSPTLPFQVQVYALDQAGAISSVLMSGSVVGTNVTLNAWTSITVAGGTLLATQAPYGAAVVVRGSDLCGVAGYLDTVEAYPFPTAPDASYEFGDATALTQAGNRTLRDVAAPRAYYEFGVQDLERAFPDDYSRLKLTLGGNVRAVDLDYGIDTTVRLLRVDRRLLKPTDTRLTLASRPTLLTSLI